MNLKILLAIVHGMRMSKIEKRGEIVNIITNHVNKLKLNNHYNNKTNILLKKFNLTKRFLIYIKIF